MRVVVTRDPNGHAEDRAYFGTDPRMSAVAILERFARRWLIEDQYARDPSGLRLGCWSRIGNGATGSQGILGNGRGGALWSIQHTMGGNMDGLAFELVMFEYFKLPQTLASLGLDPERCRVYHRKRYHSADRNGPIEVDIAIEVTADGAGSPWMLYVVECRHTSRPLTSEDVESFHQKLQQIGADRTKGRLVSTAGLTTPALHFAQTKGIGHTLVEMSDNRIESQKDELQSLSAISALVLFPVLLLIFLVKWAAPGISTRPPGGTRPW